MGLVAVAAFRKASLPLKEMRAAGNCSRPIRRANWLALAVFIFLARANVLIGRSGPTFALQPLSLQGSAAVNILLGVSSLKAAACADVTLEQARRGLL